MECYRRAEETAELRCPGVLCQPGEVEERELQVQPVCTEKLECWTYGTSKLALE